MKNRTQLTLWIEVEGEMKPVSITCSKWRAQSVADALIIQRPNVDAVEVRGERGEVIHRTTRQDWEGWL